MFGPLTLPPRLARQALEDLHTLAVGIGRLTEREGDLSALLESVRTLPRVEDELSANVESLKAEVLGCASGWSRCTASSPTSTTPPRSSRRRWPASTRRSRTCAARSPGSELLLTSCGSGGSVDGP